MPRTRFAAMTHLNRAVMGMAAAFFVHRAAGVQTSLEVIPFVGSYLPLVDFGTATRTASQFLPDSKSTYRQSIGVLVGAGLRFNTSPNIAFELTGAYVQSGWTEPSRLRATSMAVAERRFLRLSCDLTS